MTAGWRLRIAVIALALGVGGAPALSQNTVVPANTSEEVVGPPQLQNFSLDGTVTRHAETPPPRQQQQQQQQPNSPTTARADQPAAPAPTQQAERQEPSRQQPARESRETARAEAPAPAPRDSAPTGLATGSLFDLPPPTQAQPTTLAPPLPTTDAAPLDSGNGDSSGFLSLPWLLALLAAAGAAAWYFLRQRPRLAYAGGDSEFAAPEPEPQPAPRARVPAPQPAPVPEAPPVPQGIVSTRLRPWLDIAVAPHSCRLADDGATVEFEVTVVNSGSAPARDVLVEALMLNADPAQDKQIGAFFARPAGQGERIAAIPPLKSMTLRSAVRMSRDKMRQFEVEGRKLFVPLIAFNALYRYGGGDAQTSAAYLVGRDGKGDNLAPLTFESGPRQFNGLAARALEPSVRR